MEGMTYRRDIRPPEAFEPKKIPVVALVLVAAGFLAPPVIDTAFHDIIAQNVILEDIWFLNIIPVILLTYYQGFRGSLVAGIVLILDLAFVVVTDLFVRRDVDLLLLDLNSAAVHTVLMLTGTLLTAFAIGSLADRLRWMTRSVLAQSERKRREAELLRDIGLENSSFLGMKKNWHEVFEQLRGLLGADAVGWAVAAQGAEPEILWQDIAGVGEGLKAAAEDEQFLAGVLQEGKSFFRGVAGVRSEGGEMGTILAVPIRFGEEILGVLAAAAGDSGRFSRDDQHFLEQMANQAGAVMVKARLYHQIRNLATVEERFRLAREMHDSLAQEISAVHVKTLAVERLLAAGRIDSAGEKLAETREIIKRCYEEVRELIFDLKTRFHPGAGFFEELSLYLEEFEKHTDLEVQVQMAAGPGLDLGEEKQVQLVRIVQEALANVRKHARASRVAVKVHRNNGAVRVSIEDDGCGFDPELLAGPSDRHFGLAIMRERAGLIGADLTVDSRPGAGTCVVVNIPVERVDEVLLW